MLVGGISISVTCTVNVFAVIACTQDISAKTVALDKNTLVIGY